MIFVLVVILVFVLFFLFERAKAFRFRVTRDLVVVRLAIESFAVKYDGALPDFGERRIKAPGRPNTVVNA